MSLASAALLDELRAIFLSLLGGARYGVKVRLPHAAVSTVLFRRDLSSSNKIRIILSAAREHATNLAAFAAIYKATLVILKWISRHLRQIVNDNDTSQICRAVGTLLTILVDGPFPGETRFVGPGHPERSHHALWGGFLGGYMIWGRYSSVNSQIVLYLTGRVLVGLWKRVGERRVPESWRQNTYSMVAAVVWSLVMFLFEESPEVLHPSLKSSMDEIYRFRQTLSIPSSTEV